MLLETEWPLTVAESSPLSVAPAVGVKHDAAKPKMHLIDAFWYEDVARVMTYGAQKYAEENWRKLTSRSRVVSALERHLQEIKKGNYIDEETGLPHAAHIACNTMFLHYFERTKTDNDDLFYTDKSNTKE